MKQKQILFSRVAHRLLTLVIVVLTAVTSAWADEITFLPSQITKENDMTITATDTETGISVKLYHGIPNTRWNYSSGVWSLMSDDECEWYDGVNPYFQVTSPSKYVIKSAMVSGITIPGSAPLWSFAYSHTFGPYREICFWNSTGGNYINALPVSNINIKYEKLVSSVSFANSSIEMNALDTTEVKVNLKDYDSMGGIQINLNLPDGISYVDGSATLGTMATDASLSVNKVDDSKYTALITPIATGGTIKAFEGKQGQILSFKVKANKALTGQIKLSNIIGSTNEATPQEVEMPDTACNITVSKRPSDFAFAKGTQEHPDTIAVGSTDVISYVTSSSKDVVDDGWVTISKIGDIRDMLNIAIDSNAKTLTVSAINNVDYREPVNFELQYKSNADDVYEEGNASLFIQWIPIIYDNLNDTIAAAKTYSATIDEKYNKVKATLDAAITTAETVLKSTNQQDVDDATHTLYQALETAKLNIEAEECYAAVTADEYFVDDPAHNDIYTALRAALDDTPIDISKVKAAVNAAWRQYYYDLLATDVIVYTNYLRKEVEGEEDQSQFQSDIDKATIVYNDGEIQLDKPYTYYKDAYDELEVAYKAILQSQYNRALVALETQITESATAKDNLAYDENKSSLKTYIDAAAGIKDDAEVTRAGVKQLRQAKTDLANNTTTVVDKDIAQARKALTDAIAKATTDKEGTIAPVSDVVAAELAEYITIAQETAADTETTAKQLKAAADQLTANQATADEHFEAYKTAKSNLNTAISNATAKKATFAEKSTGAKAQLQDAIDAAQTVYDAAKIKTTQELVDATDILADAQDDAEDVNTQAVALAELISNATQAKNDAVDADVKADIQTAIDAVKDDLSDKSKTAADLQNDYNALNSAVSGYVNTDIAAQRNALATVIAQANTAISTTMAYDANKTELSGDVTAANAVYNNSAATAKQLLDAKNTLAGQIATITAADDSLALEALKASIIAATTRKGEIATLSTVVAEELASAITTAEEVRDSDNTAKVRVEAAKTLDAVVTTVNADLDAFNSAVSDLEDALRAATEAWQGYAETHVGVRTYLAEAIHNAQDVRDAKVTTSTANIIAATNALKDAKTAADATNTAATNLENAIATANTTKASIVDSTVLAKLETDINSAEALLADKTQTEATLTAAAQTLSNKVSSYVTEDIDIARVALANAISTANTAKDGLGYDSNKSSLTIAITTASDVKDNASATAKQLDEAKDILESAQQTIVANDLTEATNALATAISEISAYKTSLDALYAKLAEYPEEQSNFNTAVVNDLATAITTATAVQDNAAATGKDKVGQVGKLANAKKTAESALKLYYNTESQKLANEYTKDKNLNIAIKNEVSVLAESVNFEEAYNRAEEVYVSVKMKEDTYDVVDIIVARKALEIAAAKLTAAKTTWDEAVAALANKITEAQNELAAIQLPAHQSAYDALNEAIATAQGVLNEKSTTLTAEIEVAITVLDEAIKTAIKADTKWEFTDATPEFKVGTYEAGNVTYTRSGSSIADGKYGSFCLPFEVATSNFTAVYVPAPFALYNVDTDTYKMFFKKVTDATIAPNTPFLAKLNVDGTLILHNKVAVEITSTTPATPATTKIEVYNQSSTSSFVEFDADKKFVWNGTLAKKDGNTANDLTFGSNGVIYKASSYINPFRAYLQIVNVAPTAKIIVDLDEEEDATGIEEIIKTAKSNGKVYSVEGKFVGDDTNGLGKGVYIINGKKVIK